MTLRHVWFVIVAFFWTGFFVLEGFDFGVGALHTLVGRTDVERRVAINTIGPVWDGNEVWLVVAGAAMFAAFPAWYASWFSALYLALWLLLAALIIRGVSFEFRGKFDTARWRATWLDADRRIGAGAAAVRGRSGRPAGRPADRRQRRLHRLLPASLLTPYGLWVGVTLLALCLWHGASFLPSAAPVWCWRARAAAGPPAGDAGGGAGGRLRGLDLRAGPTRHRRHARAGRARARRCSVAVALVCSGRLAAGRSRRPRSRSAACRRRSSPTCTRRC